MEKPLLGRSFYPKPNRATPIHSLRDDDNNLMWNTHSILASTGLQLAPFRPTVCLHMQLWFDDRHH